MGKDRYMPKRAPDRGQVISVWEWYDAPPHYKAFAKGDWKFSYVALIPPGMMIPVWVCGKHFGAACVQAEDLKNGWTLLIGADKLETKSADEASTVQAGDG